MFMRKSIRTFALALMMLVCLPSFAIPAGAASYCKISLAPVITKSAQTSTSGSQGISIDINGLMSFLGAFLGGSVTAVTAQLLSELFRKRHVKDEDIANAFVSIKKTLDEFVCDLTKDGRDIIDDIDSVLSIITDDSEYSLHRENWDKYIMSKYPLQRFANEIRAEKTKLTGTASINDIVPCIKERTKSYIEKAEKRGKKYAHAKQR